MIDLSSTRLPESAYEYLDWKKECRFCSVQTRWIQKPPGLDPPTPRFKVPIVRQKVHQSCGQRISFKSRLFNSTYCNKPSKRRISNRPYTVLSNNIKASRACLSLSNYGTNFPFSSGDSGFSIFHFAQDPIQKTRSTKPMLKQLGEREKKRSEAPGKSPRFCFISSYFIQGVRNLSGIS